MDREPCADAFRVKFLNNIDTLAARTRNLRRVVVLFGLISPPGRLSASSSSSLSSSLPPSNRSKAAAKSRRKCKAQSRANALKHGMAGAGIALPTEDAEALQGRAEALHDQFRPATPLGTYLVDRVALAMVRTERAARHEAAVLSLRVRHAVEEFDRARLLATRSQHAEYGVLTV